jgi:hypothetical protein
MVDVVEVPAETESGVVADRVNVAEELVDVTVMVAVPVSEA